MRPAKIEELPHGRDRLIGAAVRLFGSEGFGVSVRAIADEAGVSWGLIRFYFGSKEGLMAAAEDAVLGTYLDSAVAAANAPTSQRLDELITIYGAQLPDVTRYLRRTILEGKPIAKEFIRRLMAGDNIYAHLQADFPGETWLTDPIRMLTPRLGTLLAAPLFQELLGRDPFSKEELRKRNAQIKRMIDLIRLGLETERKVKQKKSRNKA